MTFVLTTGEPAGIGPDIVLQLWARHPELFSGEKIRVIANAELLLARAKILNIDYHIDAFSLLDLPLKTPCIPGKLAVSNANYVMQMLTIAAKGCMSGEFDGMITGPIHKGILNDAGFQLAGHTDFLTRFTHTKRTVMMLMTDQLKVALFSDHIPLREVPNCLTAEAFSECLEIILKDLKEQFHIPNPRILICGLNPHAGENGHLGTEEQTIMIPVIKQFQAAQHTLIGPVSADTAFTPAMRNQADVILAMYHDQGLPTLKYAGFHSAINVTLGLPFVRTSVDHGTALDLAGTGQADTNSLQQAILLAQSLSRKNHHA